MFNVSSHDVLLMDRDKIKRAACCITHVTFYDASFVRNDTGQLFLIKAAVLSLQIGFNQILSKISMKSYIYKRKSIMKFLILKGSKF